MKKKLSAISNEKGIALVMVLILSLISLAIMAGLIYMLTSGTQISGMQKRYKTALEASKGGKDISYQIVGMKAYPSDIKDFVETILNAYSASVTTPDTCVVSTSAIDLLPDGTSCNDHTGDCASWPAGYRGLCVKLNLPEYCWSNCNKNLTIDISIPSTYDMAFELGSAPFLYRAHAKIVDTVWGNSAPTTEDLGGGKGVVDSGSELSTMHVPYLYTIEVDAENLDNPAERAKLSVMYQF